MTRFPGALGIRRASTYDLVPDDPEILVFAVAHVREQVADHVLAETGTRIPLAAVTVVEDRSPAPESYVTVRAHYDYVPRPASCGEVVARRVQYIADATRSLA